MKRPDLQSLRQSPVIIIGMHRSGTTMVTKILEECGIFMGSRKERNCESIFFVKLNNWLLSQAGAAWDNPSAFTSFLQHRELMEQLLTKLNFFLNSFLIINYLGVGKLLRYRSLNHLPIAWGWKDPRNTFTLPLWLELFPEAKIVHVYRHGVDVAASLMTRNQKFFNNYPLDLSRKIHKNFYLSRRSFYRLSIEPTPHCFDIESSFSLWTQYMRQIKQIKKKYNRVIHEVKYEDFLNDPSRQLSTLTRKLGVPLSDKKISSLVMNVNSERKYAYLKDKKLVDFAEKYTERLAEFGYNLE